VRRALAALAALALTACPTPEFADPEDIECGSEEVVVTFPAADGVDLVADYLPAEDPNAGAVVLFHMAPPSNDRSGFPPAVRATLGDGFNVLNVDRRGAGDSGGNPGDATQGAMARWDMEAATGFLTRADRVCPVDSTHFVLVGASNGTTSVMDYVVDHAGELPHPSGLIWMSPGTYTEDNNRVLDNRETLDALPMLWLYPEDEPYSDQWTAGAPPDWTFHRDGTEHGTDMFDGGELQADTVERMGSFVQRWAD